MASSVIYVFLFALFYTGIAQYEPTWQSIDSRPIPAWYDEAKLGIFLHWGVFAVPCYRSEWFWWFWQSEKDKDFVDFMKANYRPGWTYGDFANQFTTELYDPVEWAKIFKAAGAKYVVLTSKHLDGFCNWPTSVSFNWNSMEVGPHRDLVGELADAIRNTTDIHFGLYHSLKEWFNPLYLNDMKNNFTTDTFVRDKTMPELYELVNRYKPELIWSDGQWDAPDTYFMSRDFIAWLYNESPVKDKIVINDRWGVGTTCKHGGYLTCTDRYNPGTLQKRKFENAMTLDLSAWGYRRDLTLDQLMTMKELIKTFVMTVSCGGNMLLNIGPTKSGRIIPVFEERLRQLGEWLNVNGEAIYSSKPWTYQNDTQTGTVWYTSKKFETGSVTVYAISLTWPRTSLVLAGPEVSSETEITLLGYQGKIDWKKRSPRGMEISIPLLHPDDIPCQWAWTFKISYVIN